MSDATVPVIHPSSVVELIAGLHERDVRFNYDAKVDRLHLAATNGAPISPIIVSAAREHRAWLVLVALGRSSGHVLAACDRCGELTMTSMLKPSGAERDDRADWPCCRRSPQCPGRHVPRPIDLVGIERVRPPARHGRAPKLPNPYLLGPISSYPGVDDRR